MAPRGLADLRRRREVDEPVAPVDGRTGVRPGRGRILPFRARTDLVEDGHSACPTASPFALQGLSKPSAIRGIMRLALLLVLPLAVAAPLAAQDDSGLRFEIAPSGAGVTRVDTRTGTVSHCSQNGAV